LSRTYRRESRPQWASSREETFRFRRCKLVVGPPPSGGRRRNHCPYCLHSRHVDGARPGDRASDCGSLMAPIGYFIRPNGEFAIIHRCLGCAQHRHNRIAADDDFDLVRTLPDRTRQLEEEPSAETYDLGA
jgi:RNHCP domain